MSKGSKQRPVDRKKFDENYERIFGKKTPTTEAEPRDHVAPEENFKELVAKSQEEFKQATFCHVCDLGVGN